MIRVTTDRTIRRHGVATVLRPHARHPAGRLRLPDVRNRPARPALPRLRMVWVQAPDGRGLMASWTDDPQRWQQPAPRRARRAFARARA